ncbi:MAG: hypothetical protein IPL52_09660 [Flavobacteriales bacterium]|nr:hypothetical protein [Flavobacteriales bacterium]
MKPTGAIELPSGLWADTVLVAFDTQEPVGTLRRLDGMGEEHAIHAVFDAPAAIALKGLLGPGLKEWNSPGVQVLKVNRLRVDELDNQAVCMLHAEVLVRSGDAYSRRFESSVLVSGDRCGKRPDCHQENIFRAIREFLKDYGAAIRASELTPIDVPPAELTTAFAIDTLNTPALSNAPPRRGLYRTYMQFRSNRPDTLFDFDIKEAMTSPGDNGTIRLKRMPGSAVEQYWGLCDGAQAYVRVGRSFVRLYREGPVFTASVPQPLTYDPTTAMLGGLFFGMIGGGIAGGLATTPNPPILCEVNMLCGDLVPRNRRTAKSDYAVNIFHVSPFAKSESAVTVACENVLPVALTKRQWTSFQLPPRSVGHNVRITGPINAGEISITTNSDKLHVYLIDVKKDGNVSVNDLNEQMRNALMDNLKTEDKRPLWALPRSFYLPPGTPPPLGFCPGGGGSFFTLPSSYSMVFCTRPSLP